MKEFLSAKVEIPQWGEGCFGLKISDSPHIHAPLTAHR